MSEFIHSHIKLEHLLCALIFISRLGDIGSTYLVTPKLKLEANPIVRKFGWWYAIATLAICLVPYYSTAMAIIVLVPSLMVSASNTGKVWFVRAYGESAYLELLLSVARKSRLSHALVPTIVAALFIALVGLTMMLFCPDPTKDWGYWFGAGVIVYAVAIGFHGSMFFIRLFRNAKHSDGLGQSAQPVAAPNAGSASAPPASGR